MTSFAFFSSNQPTNQPTNRLPALPCLTLPTWRRRGRGGAKGKCKGNRVHKVSKVGSEKKRKKRKAGCLDALFFSLFFLGGQGRAGQGRVGRAQWIEMYLKIFGLDRLVRKRGKR